MRLRIRAGLVPLIVSMSGTGLAQNDVPVLSITSKDRANVVEFLNPPEGDYLLARVIGRPDQFARTPTRFGSPPIFVPTSSGIRETQVQFPTRISQTAKPTTITSSCSTAARRGHPGLSRLSGWPDDIVYMGTRNAGVKNAFHALDASDGHTLWSFDDPGGDGIGIISGGASIDYVNQVAYFASHEFIPGAGTVWAVDLATGAKVWSTPLGSVSGSPIQRGNFLYLGIDDGLIHALDIADGSPKLNFPFDTKDGVTKGFVFHDLVSDRVYVSTQTTVWSLRDVEPIVNKKWSHPGISGPSIPTHPPATPFSGWVRATVTSISSKSVRELQHNPRTRRLSNSPTEVPESEARRTSFSTSSSTLERRTAPSTLLRRPSNPR